MIIVDGREIKFPSETREETTKIIIDAIEKEYLSDETIEHIQLACLVAACNAKLKEKK